STHAAPHRETSPPATARHLITLYRHQPLTSNDDRQGPGALTLAAVLAGARASRTPLTRHRVVIYGSGTAGIGIADQLHEAMTSQGLDTASARARFRVLDRPRLPLSRPARLRALHVPSGPPP